MLIVYFSHTNTTRLMAQKIHVIVGGDILELKTKQPYPHDHKSTVRQGEQERRDDSRPKLVTVFPSNMDDHDVIFVGYPVWAYTMPMAFFTFFDQYAFAEKTIVPFSTHLGSGLSGGPRDIAALCPKATILQGLAIYGTQISTPQTQREIEKWLHNLSLPSRQRQ